MYLSNIVDDIAFVDLGHLATDLVHKVVALVIAFYGFVELSEALVCISQRHRAACLVEEVADFVVVFNANFGIMHHMLEVVVVEEIKNHRAQNLQLDFVLVGVGVKVRLTADGLVDGNGGLIGGLSPAVFKDMVEAVNVLGENCRHKCQKKSKKQ